MIEYDARTRMDDAWKVGFDETRPLIPRVYEWCAIFFMVGIHCWWVDKYTENSNAMKWGNAPIWVCFLIFQLVGIGWSWVACNYLFIRFPVILRIPFLFIGFTPAFLVYSVPFVTDFGLEFATNAPLWVFQAWSLVRFCIETSIQLHAKFGVKGISWWLLTPFQKSPEE